MDRTCDIAIIGGGVAGVAAALAAAAQGARVCVLRAGPGATGLCSGAWRGPLPDALARALAGAGLEHTRCDRALPHPAGDQRACDFAPASHAAARIDRDTLVCGIAGLPGFYAPALARLWADAAGATPSHSTVMLAGTPATGWSPVSLAAALDREATLLTRALTDALRAKPAGQVLLPAILGLQQTAHITESISAATGVEVAESLGAAPSLPGWRLAQALEQALRRGNIEVITGRAVRIANGNRRIARVKVTAAGADVVEVGASAFVLATGKFAGGGIAGDARLHEPVLGCPVWIDHLGHRFDAPNPLVLTNAERNATQPLLAAGVRVDAESRPTNAAGDVIYENVVVAGSVRAGVCAAELGLGHAAGDGWRAGLRAAAIAA